jgi:hypothetical protein
MTPLTLDELRSIIDLGARARADKIPQSDIERQERTVLRACALLAIQPGVVLADEVGMGKTFEALGVAAVVHHQTPRAKILIITPGPDLNTKWDKELQHFAAVHRFGHHAAIRRISELPGALRGNTVTVAPMTMFQGGRGDDDQAWLLSMYFRWKQFHGRRANAILSRYRDGKLGRVDVHEHGFLDRYSPDALGDHALRRAFVRGRSGEGHRGLDDLFEEEGLDAFGHERDVRRALHRARSVLIGSLLPPVDLLVVDEAHKLKSTGALRTRGLRAVMDRHYHKALFLTATPFQLHVEELRQVFRVFTKAKGAPKDLDDRIGSLLESIGEYQRRYNDFQSVWGQLEIGQAAEFRARYSSDPSLGKGFEDPSLEIVRSTLRELVRLKDETIEPELRRWMIRSLREGKRGYRDHRKSTLATARSTGLPFLIYERLIAQLFRDPHEGGTHKAAAEINMVSSYAAARDGALLSDHEERRLRPEAHAYRSLLRTILDDMARQSGAHHPKIAFSLEDGLEAGERGEKTLVFCARVATLRTLKAQLDEAWQERLLRRWQGVHVDADADVIFGDKERGEDGAERRSGGRHQAVQKRLGAHGDALYLALRERYLHTVLPIAGWARAHVDELVPRANAALQELRVGKSAAERRDFKLAKRCVEHAAAVCWHDAGSPVAALQGKPHEDGLGALLDSNYVSLGLDLVADEHEQDERGEHQPRWSIDDSLAVDVIGDGRSLWAGAAELLATLDRPQRVRLTELLGRYLGFVQVSFVAELLLAAKAAGVGVDPLESRPMLRFIDGFWDQPEGQPWRGRVLDFLRFFVDREAEQREIILDEVLESGKAAFARHTKDAAGRERLREAFNTPLYPMVLIANEVMQEGLDLHRSCRRVVHHDLAWNPAQLEQRVGRVDRLGSRLLRLREVDRDARLEVVYPLVQGTIDERLYEVVRRREKWLEFLLGAPPNLQEYRLGDEEPPALPDGLAERLAVDLGPTAGGT